MLASLTLESFDRLYFGQKKTLRQIGSLYGVSKVSVFRWYRKHKDHLTPNLRPGGRLASHEETERVFSSWTPEMAYALGVLATDGCVHQYAVTLSCTDLEMVEKVRVIAKSESVIKTIAPRGNSKKTQYRLQMNSIALVRILTEVGVTPHKSLTLRFPEMPEECVRHFIRGCWDGDGSFYKTHGCRLHASYVSGSRVFVEAMVSHLEASGIKPGPRHIWRHDKRGTLQQKTFTGISIHTQKPRDEGHGKNPSYSFRLSHKHAVDFGNWLYAGVPNTMYMERKYSVWQKAWCPSLQVQGSGS